MITSILRVHEDEITGLLELPNKNRILTCSIDGTLVCLDLDTPKPLEVIDFELPVRCMTANDSEIVILSNSNTLTFLSVADDYAVRY